MGKNNKDKRTWTKKNTARLINKSTIKGNVVQTLKSLQSSFLTLGSGNLYQAIDIPEEMFEDALDLAMERGLNKTDAQAEARHDALNEWVAANTVDFFNEINLLYGLVQGYHEETYRGKDQGFPSGFAYRFNGIDIVNGTQYVTTVCGWIEAQIDDPEIFPELDTEPFPAQFLKQMGTVFKRMTRIFAIMYATCLESFKEIEAVPHLNTCFKHFYYFVKRYELLSASETKKEFAAFDLKKVKKSMDIKNFEVQYKKDKQAAEASK